MREELRRLRQLAPLLLLICSVLLPAAAGADAGGAGAEGTGWGDAGEERILDYAVSAVVGEDAVMTVTERITVSIANRRIRHGIFRLFLGGFFRRFFECGFFLSLFLQRILFLVHPGLYPLAHG